MALIVPSLRRERLLWNAGLGVFHSGVEWKWWPGPQECAGTLDDLGSAGGFLNKLQSITVVRCDEAGGHGDGRGQPLVGNPVLQPVEDGPGNAYFWAMAPSNARSIASLTISFGLVAIPVKLYSATESKGGISFNLLHSKCGGRVRYQTMCAREDIPISRDEIVKGYEFAKDQYVLFTPEELKVITGKRMKASPPTHRMMP